MLNEVCIDNINGVIKQIFSWDNFSAKTRIQKKLILPHWQKSFLVEN